MDALARQAAAGRQGQSRPASASATPRRPRRSTPVGDADQVVIEPQVERRDVKPPQIDTENWEVGIYVGSLSVEDFEVNSSTAHASPTTSTRTSLPRRIVGTSDAGLSSFERLSGSAPLLTDSERQFTYYSLGFGWNALPGEVFLGGKRA